MPLSSGRVRGAAALAAMAALMLSACSSGSPTASPDESPPPTSPPPTERPTERDSEAAIAVDLSTLDGDFVVTSSNPRVVTATGAYEGASVSIEGGRLHVRFALGESTFLVDGTASVSCGSDECDWFHPGVDIPLSMTSVGGPPFPIVSMSDGQPPYDGCGASPGDAWVVDSVAYHAVSFVASRTGGGGADPDCFRVLFDVEMTRA